MPEVQPPPLNHPLRISQPGRANDINSVKNAIGKNEWISFKYFSYQSIVIQIYVYIDLHAIFQNLHTHNQLIGVSLEKLMGVITQLNSVRSYFHAVLVNKSLSI